LERIKLEKRGIQVAALRSNAAQEKGNRDLKTVGMEAKALRRLDAGSADREQLTNLMTCHFEMHSAGGFNKANAKLSCPDQATKLWSDVDGKEKRS
jgi:hypothetical protein